MFALGFGALGLHWIVTFLFWVAIVTLGIWLMSDLASSAAPTTSTPAESALDILNQRYARGEISKTDYEIMRRDLES